MWRTTCLNCGASLTGAFCSECGQRAVPPYPTLSELGGEAFGELSGWDGKILATLRVLAQSPGKLTTEFLEGRRARYISPVRLYLWVSVLYFVLAAARNDRGPAKPGQMDLGILKASITNSTPNATGAGLTQQQRDDMLAEAAFAPRILRPVMIKMVNDPGGFQKDVFEAIPKGMFVLLPAFAGIMALFYRRRRFAEHVYFAVHVHTLLFLALVLTALVNFTHVVALEVFVGIGVLIWVPTYWHLALRRVYGGSHGATALRELGIATLYGLATIPVLIALAIWVASR